MIEMHLGEDPIGDDEDDTAYPSRASQFWRLAFAAPSLAIASLAVGLASLMVIQAADEIGETALFGSHNHNLSNLTQIRITAAVRLVIALIAVVLALVSGLRVFASDTDDEPSYPSWVGAVAGAGLVVALVSVLVSGASLVYALQSNSVIGN